jgi:hypothetical protein
MLGEEVEVEIIHPMCPIEEYASNGRRWGWLNPPAAPTVALARPMNKASGLFWCSEEIRIVIGASFCQVASRAAVGQGILFITEGNQK